MEPAPFRGRRRARIPKAVPARSKAPTRMNTPKFTKGLAHNEMTTGRKILTEKAGH